MRRLIETPRRQVLAAVSLLALLLVGSFGYDQWLRRAENLAHMDAPDAIAIFRHDVVRGGARLAVTLMALFGSAWLLIVQLERRQRADGRFRELLEAAPDAMVIVDPKGRIALINAQTESLFGYGRAELLGRPVEILMPERYRQPHGAHFTEYRANPRVRPMGQALELPGRRKDGSEFPVEISLSPLPNQDHILMSAAIRDVSRRKAVEAELVEARRTAEAASAAKSTFLAGMSHELRTPLNAVIGFAQMLELDCERLSPKQRDYVQYIITGGHHLLELVSQVLDLASIEAGRLKLTLGRVNVRKAVEEARQTMLPLAQNAGIALDLQAPAVLPAIRVDEMRLRQVLLNLVSNAIKYNRPGGTVSLTSIVRPGCVRLTVADTGTGIPPERQAEIFTPFQRLGAERRGVEGTGIGLALSRQLVEAMHGTIGFVSVPGSGSSFWVEFPCAEATVAAGADAADATKVALR